jgi:hypothetical protein
MPRDPHATRKESKPGITRTGQIPHEGCGEAELRNKDEIDWCNSYNLSFNRGSKIEAAKAVSEKS